jgi:phosphoesterase RecJ-like protein
MNYKNTNAEIKEKAPLILAEIRKAKSILLHCHPSPDPDSVGSALAMKFAIEQLGVKATVIKGDSDIPEAFMHFPGADQILMKSFWEIDPNDYDLFIIVDSALSGVSRLKPITELPSSMMVINIDHHKTNKGDGKINLVDPSYPAVAQLLYDLFIEMGMNITPEIAGNLFMGIYSDTGGFKYEGVNPATYSSVAELIRIRPDFSRMVAVMENSNTIDDLTFKGLALVSMETACDNNILLSVIPFSSIESKKIPDISISAGKVSTELRTIKGFGLFVAMIEPRPNKIKLSFRTSDSDKYDVSLLAASLGGVGGGHKAAAGAVLDMSLEEAKALVVSKAKELYNL